MDDLISRKAAIERIKLQMDRPDTFGWWTRNDKIAEACYKIAIEILERLPSAETFSYGHENDWIPVSERLPEDYRDVLVWFEYFRYGDYNCMYSTYGIGNYSNQYDSWLINHETGWTDLHVFAWMPMPEPPKKEANKATKKLDHGKICALRKTGWPVSKIADEMGCSGPTVRYHLDKEGIE